MILSRRERLIITLALIVVSIFVLDRFVLGPLLASYSTARAKKGELQAEKDRSASLLDRREQIGRKWRQMLAGGLKQDPAEAESQLLHALGDWSQEAGLDLSSLRPERPGEKTDLRKVICHAVGSGSMASVSRFLWLVETAEIPVKLEAVQLRSRKEGTDDLALQVRLSTLYLADDEESKPPEGASQ